MMGWGWRGLQCGSGRRIFVFVWTRVSWTAMLHLELFFLFCSLDHLCPSSPVVCPLFYSACFCFWFLCVLLSWGYPWVLGDSLSSSAIDFKLGFWRKGLKSFQWGNLPEDDRLKCSWYCRWTRRSSRPFSFTEHVCFSFALFRGLFTTKFRHSFLHLLIDWLIHSFILSSLSACHEVGSRTKCGYIDETRAPNLPSRSLPLQLPR